MKNEKSKIQKVKYKINNWREYWELFDVLIDLLNADNKADLAGELRKAQLHVNGLTDGWHGFKIAFENSVNDHKEILRSEQRHIANVLIDVLRLNFP